MNIGSVLASTADAVLSPLATATSGARGGVPARPLGSAAGKGAPPILGALMRGLTGAAARREAEALGALLGRLIRGALAGAATGTGSATKAATASKSSGSSKASGGSGSSSASLAFLKDPKLSVEEKLARLMVHLSDKYEKQLEEKLRQYADLEAGRAPGASTSSSTSSSSSSSSSTKSGSSKGSTSPLGAIGEALSGLVSKTGLGSLLSAGGGLSKLVSQVSGPVLAAAATALGMPALSPLLLKAGPLLGAVAGGALSSLSGSGKEGAAASGTGSTPKAASSGSGSTSTASSGAAPPSEKQLMTEIQILQEKQKEMFALVSNILRSLHDTKMAVIANIR